MKYQQYSQVIQAWNNIFENKCNNLVQHDSANNMETHPLSEVF